eukprot:1160885-Pelagomonas_calceolata.AAC.3
MQAHTRAETAHPQHVVQQQQKRGQFCLYCHSHNQCHSGIQKKDCASREYSRVAACGCRQDN